MDLNRHVVTPMTDPTGVRALVGMTVGGIAGVVLALPVLAAVFGL